MSNDTQTPSSQTEPSVGESPQGPNGTNGGFDSVAAQYRAMQEAQLLHEETINQLREEIRGQREKLAELAKTSPNAKAGQVDIVMMRLTELERKIGEGAPDPLLNEIVHRLAALENNGPVRGAKDPRVDEVYKQLDGLRQQIEDAGGSDSRTDDVVLRVASLEAAFRRAAQSRDPEEVQARIDTLAEELNSRQEAELAELRSGFAEAAKAASEAAEKTEDDGASAAALEAVTERLSAVEESLAGKASQEQLTALGEQLADLDRKLTEQLSAEPDTAALEEIANRVDAIEQKLPEPSGSADSEQLENLRAKLTELESSPTVAALRERVESLSTQLADSDTPQRLLELAGRLRSLENKTEEERPASDSNEVEQLGERLARLEEDAAPRAALDGIARLDDIARLDTELRAIQAVSQEAGVQQPSPELTTRLDELETRIADAESATRLEDAHSRLKTVEGKWEALGDPVDVGRRLTVLEMDDKAADPRVDDLVQRLAAFEEKPFESISDDRLEDLSTTVAELRGELEKISSESLPVLTELPERLTRLEVQVRAIAAAPAPAPVADQPEIVSQLQANLQSLGSRLDELAGQPTAGAQDPRVSEIAARLEWVERKASSLPEPSDVSLDDLKSRLEQIEQGLASGGSGEGVSSGLRAEIAGRLNALEEALASQGQQGAADVEGLLRKETERWNQWARSTIDEIGEIRGRIDSLGSSSSGLDAESVEALGIQISNGLNTSEVKSLRGQMYFVYLSIGVLWALVLYLLFAG